MLSHTLPPHTLNLSSSCKSFSWAVLHTIDPFSVVPGTILVCHLSLTCLLSSLEITYVYSFGCDESSFTIDPIVLEHSFILVVSCGFFALTLLCIVVEFSYVLFMGIILLCALSMLLVHMEHPLINTLTAFRLFEGAKSMHTGISEFSSVEVSLEFVIPTLSIECPVVYLAFYNSSIVPGFSCVANILPELPVTFN